MRKSTALLIVFFALFFANIIHSQDNLRHLTCYLTAMFYFVVKQLEENNPNL